jgi:hypothetical protein
VPGAGCYGHNGADDVALDAALVARAVPGVPVKLQWMRDDEFAWAKLQTQRLPRERNHETEVSEPQSISADRPWDDVGASASALASA